MVTTGANYSYGHSSRLVPLRAELSPGMFYVLLQGQFDTVPIARRDYDANVQPGDELYLLPQTMTVWVMRDGKVVARIPTA